MIDTMQIGRKLLVPYSRVHMHNKRYSNLHITHVPANTQRAFETKENERTAFTPASDIPHGYVGSR